MRIKLQHAKIDYDRFNADGFYFEIQADGNHETLATSEIYNTHAAAMHAIRLIAPGGDWEIIDETQPRTIVTTTED